MNRSAIALWWMGALLAGCGDPMPVTDDDGGAGLDGGPRDAGLPIDAPDDAPPITPDAGAPEPCPSPGATETVACGRCGTVERFCAAGGTWAYGACTGEGVCEAGTGGTQPCGSCGTQPAVCTATCEWESTGACGGEGPCAPGTRRRSSDGCLAGSARDLLCSDACVLEPDGACEPDGCTVPGAIENVACGMCGSRSRFCTAALAWDYGDCEGERSCLPGTSRVAGCGAMCGTTTERCDATCTWVAGVCGGAGVCTPGATMRTGDGCTSPQTRLLRCSATCDFTEIVEPCAAPMTDAGRPDAATIDAGTDGGRDAGLDGGPRDAGAFDAGPPPATIGAIQRGEILEGARVIVRDLVVTAVRADTIWAQDPLGGTTYAGIKVYMGGAHTVVRHDRVDVDAIVHEYFGDTELVSAVVVVRGVATPIAALALTVAQAATEPYEGMLVRLTDVTTFDYPHDCATDNPLCTDSGLWEVNGAGGVVVYDQVYESADWLARVGRTSITGVMSFRFDRRRILPRTSADLP